MKIIDFEHHYFSKPFYEFLIKNKDKLSKSSELIVSSNCGIR